MFPVGLLVNLNCYILLKIYWLEPTQHSFSVSHGNVLILKILWNYFQEFIKANGGRPFINKYGTCNMFLEPNLFSFFLDVTTTIKAFGLWRLR